MASEGMILVRTSDLNEWGDESHSLFPPRIKAKAGSLQGLLSIISSWKKNFQFLFTGGLDYNDDLFFFCFNIFYIFCS
jgi:hypothetical protein